MSFSHSTPITMQRLLTAPLTRVHLRKVAS
jgi:hypothetical protein